MDTASRARNEAALTRLRGLAERLTPEDLDRSLGEGWTVKAALLHLAFWDRFAAAVIHHWQRAGFTPAAKIWPKIGDFAVSRSGIVAIRDTIRQGNAEAGVDL